MAASKSTPPTPNTSVSVPVAPTRVGLTESEAVIRLLGSDPWMRWDVWANRAWDAAERAAVLAAESGPTINPDEGLDHRIITLFHAAELAKTFAEMINPIMAVQGFDCQDDFAPDNQPEMTINMVINNEEME